MRWEGGFRIGNTCTSVADTCECMAKPIQYCKVKKKKNSDDHYINYSRKESLGRNGVAIIVNKRVRNAVLACNLKNDRIISVRFQGKPFNITVIQVYAPTSNAEEAEVERFYEDLQDILDLKDVLSIIGDSRKRRKSRNTWSNR